MTTCTPQNIEAEQAVLGAVLMDSDSLVRAAEIVGPEHFYRKAHQLIFAACMELYGFGNGIDLIEIVEHLKHSGTLEQIGGVSYLSTLMDIVPTSANISYHARIVKDKAMLRQAKTWASGVVSRIEDGTQDIETLYSELENGVNDLAQAVELKKNPYADSVISNIHRDWEDFKNGKVKYCLTDYKLQSAIPAFFPHLWMIGGYTSNGKSSLLAQIVVDGCEEGIKPVIFSLEDTCEEKMMKLIANLADVSQRDLLTGNIAGEEDAIRRAEVTLRKWGPIIYDDVYTIEEIRLKAKKHKMQDGINMVCIDYVQNLEGHGDAYQTMKNASSKLDRMKKDLKCTIIALSQVTNESVKNPSEVIALKGAGELASAADIVLWLRRLKGEGKERHLDVEVRKNRPFGDTHIIPMIFSDRWTRIDKRGM